MAVRNRNSELNEQDQLKNQTPISKKLKSRTYTKN